MNELANLQYNKYQPYQNTGYNQKAGQIQAKANMASSYVFSLRDEIYICANSGERWKVLINQVYDLLPSGTSMPKDSKGYVDFNEVRNLIMESIEKEKAINESQSQSHPYDYYTQMKFEALSGYYKILYGVSM